MHTQLPEDSYTILQEYTSQMNQIKEDSQASQSLLVAKPGEDNKDKARIELPDTNTKAVRHASCTRQDCIFVFYM